MTKAHSTLTLIFMLSLTLLQSISFAAGTRLIAAASSNTAFALKAIAHDFEVDTGLKVVLSFGSTGKLTQQIENGAPFDLFFAADTNHIDTLRRKGLIVPDSQRLYARGVLALVVNKRSGLDVKELKDILNRSIQRIAIANPDFAPYGMAAKEALMNAGIWKEVGSKLVYGENIRQALQFVQTGNLPIGIVALSVAEVPEVSHTLVDETLYTPINQAVAIIKTSRHPKAALSFIEYVTGPKGRAVLEEYGFYIPRSAQK